MMLVTGLPLSGSSSAGGLTVHSLRCEEEIDPIAIDTPRPRLSWQIASSARNARQIEYRIKVASHPDLLAPEATPTWDSGWIKSSRQFGIEYEGPPQPSNSSWYWRVQIHDSTGTPSDWSPVAKWSVGPKAGADWKARWIGATTSHSLPVFRRGFEVKKPLRRAVVHVCGLGQFELFLDGKKIGHHFLDPVWSHYERRIFYVSFDVTPYLGTGKHAFGVMLGKGFFNTEGDRRIHGVQSNRPLRLLLQASLVDEDSSEQIVVSDEAWRAHAGPVTHSAILGGEDHDARLLDPNWARADYDDSNWSNAIPAEAPPGELRSQGSPAMSYRDRFAPIRIDEVRPGVFVYDFGQNASAIPRIRARGKSGETIRLIPAEQRQGSSMRRNDGRGPVDQAGVGRPNYFQYTLAGRAVEEWQPQFTYSGFQYLQVEGGIPAGRGNPNDLPVIEELESIHVRNEAATVGSFACSNPLLERIDRGIDWAVRANLSHVLTDCPHREKLGWLEVAYLMGPSIAGRYDVGRFLAKIATDCADAQIADGRIPTVAPPYPRFSGGFAYTPEWGAAGVVIPELAMTWFQDRRTLRDSFPTMQRFVEYMDSTSTNGVPLAGLGDWYDYGHGKALGASQFTPPELTAMATQYRCTRILADTARRLGNMAEHEKQVRRGAEIRDAFNRRYFRENRAEYAHRGSPQTGSSMALVLGLVPEGYEIPVLGRVVEDLRWRGNQQTAGDIGYPYLVEALAKGGRSDVLYDMVTRTNLGSYGYIVNNGWTAMPEAWDADTGASMNHCMLGHIQQWFTGYLGGIRPDPDHPGFERFTIGPEPVGDLTWAKAHLDSIRGRIESAWRRANDGFHLDVAIPANSRARIILPAESPGQIREGGKTLGEVSDITVEERLPGRVILEAGSGRYTFHVSPPSAAR